MCFYLLLPLFLLVGCSRDESTKTANLKGEYLYRHSSEHFYQVAAPSPLKRELYTWEKKYQGKYPVITKDFFRCKGNAFNSAVVKKREGKEDIFFRDCAGADHHGLPMRDGKEFIYPCLVQILNYLQDKTAKRVVITSGHRCPEHNTYCDHSSSNFGSKHMIGAEVDFYVEGMEQEPEKVIALLHEYYRGQREYEKFERYEKSDLMTKPWFNKEVFIKLYRDQEGRNFDNQHGYPYIALQVRYDRVGGKKVTYDEKEAKNYLRY